MTVFRCTELEELFAWTNIWEIRLLLGHWKHPFPWAATPKLPSAPILKQIPVLEQANPGNEHQSFYSESFRNLFITRGTEYREWLVENITWQLASKFSRWELPVAREKRVIRTKTTYAKRTFRIFRVSLQSRSLFQPRSRPFLWLLPRTQAWIRKNTDCFAVYSKNENRINWYGWPNKITAGLNLFRSLIFDCNNFLQREPKRQLYFVIASLTKSCFVWGFSIFSFCTPAGDIYGRPLLISMEEHTFSLGYNNGWRHGLDPYADQWFTYTYTYTYTPGIVNRTQSN